MTCCRHLVMLNRYPLANGADWDQGHGAVAPSSAACGTGAVGAVPLVSLAFSSGCVCLCKWQLLK